MSQLKVDNITDELGTGAPDFPNGLTGVVPASSITGALNASGAAPIFASRAWVNFDGTLASGNIRASGNVSSVSRTGTGAYTVNFAAAMSDANYAASLSKSNSFGSMGVGDFTTGSLEIRTRDGNQNLTNINAGIYISVFR